jgi:alginate O-acetyltransferase complex protein AlgI
MAINSLSFLFLFLPLTVLGLVLLFRWHSPRAVMVYLLLASLIFYALAQPLYLVVLLGSVAFNYWLGTMLADESRPHRRVALWLGWPATCFC